MIRKEEKVYLEYILDALQKIAQLTAQENAEAAFYADWVVQDAVIRRMQTMAETTQRLSDGTKQAMPTVAWQDIAGLRNILVHGYLGTIDMETVWSIVTTVLPEFEISIRAFYEVEYL